MQSERIQKKTLSSNIKALPAACGKCFGLLFGFICSHSACRRCPPPQTDHLRRSQEIRSVRVGRIRQPGNLFCQTGRTDYHPLHLPHIDHIVIVDKNGMVMPLISSNL